MKTSTKALALCHAIEAAGASKQLTKCSVLASEIRDEITNMEIRDSQLVVVLRSHAAQCFPEIVLGQKHFVRVLMESVAEELSSLGFLDDPVPPVARDPEQENAALRKTLRDIAEACANNEPISAAWASEALNGSSPNDLDQTRGGQRPA